MKTIKFLLAILFSIAIAACGGGGGYGGGSAPTYSISGTVSGTATSGVLITVSGTATATAITGAGGTYTISGLANGSYTVTPSLGGKIFTPNSRSVTVSGTNMTAQNFVAANNTLSTYSISGTISGAPSGMTIALTGGSTGSTVTSTGGTYTFTGLLPGTYTLTPSSTSFTFAPTSTSVTIVAGPVTATTIVANAIPVAHTISGTVSGPFTSGVLITVTGTATATATTGAGGTYTVPGLFDGSYTVTPSYAGYTFTPNSTAVTISGANLTGKNFTSAVVIAPTYTLSGTVTGPYVAGVTITMSGAATATTTTNASGAYSFANLPAGTYTLTPTLAGYAYIPAAPAVTVSANTVQGFVASSAVTSYSISGTVSYPVGTKTGPVYLRVFNSVGCTNCSSSAGTLIAAPGTYTIRGLQPNTYTVTAEMDTLNTGAPNATNPAGSSATATISGANLTGVNITITDPTLPAPVTPAAPSIFPGNGSAFVQYSPPTANGQEIATSYKIYWGTTNTALTGGGNTTFAAQGNNQNVYILSGLTDTAVLYFKMSAIVGATESALSAASGPVTIGATTGANTVSGTVTFPVAATGPMIVGLFSNTGIYFKRYTSPSSPLSYSIAGVASGSYQSFAVLDMNGNGLIDTGDLSNTNNNTPSITVSGATTSNLTLNSATTATVNTDHWSDGVSSGYSLNLGINDGIKRSVAVTLISGLNVAVPFDMGANTNNNTMNVQLSTTPAVNDSYVFQVTVTDGITLTTQNITGSVTGVLSSLNSFASSLTPVTSGGLGTACNNVCSTTVPLFTWVAPVSPPTPYTYKLNLNGITDSTNWNYPKDNDLPSTTLSALYNADGQASGPLTSTFSYRWQVQVRDGNRNSATRQTTYAVP
jgi:uncharacterized protein (DUF2141 family)